MLREETIAIAKCLAALPVQKKKIFQKALRKKGIDWRLLPIVPQVKTSDHHPLSAFQQRLWFLEQLDPGTPFYHLFSKHRFLGALNLVILERCLNEIVRRHDSLRTGFISVNGEGRQVVHDFQPTQWEVTDLSTCHSNLQTTMLKNIEREEAFTPLTLSRPPLFRVRIVKCGAAEHLIMFTVHHLVFDAWSVGLLFMELRELYTALVQGHSSPLPELPIQYSDYTAWQQEWFESEDFETQQRYWVGQLADAPSSLALPFDHPRTPHREGNGAVESLILSEALTRDLYALCHRQQATLYMALLSVFYILLERYSGQQEMCVGTSIANRSRSETEQLIGSFVNTLVLRNDLSGNPTFLEFLDRVKRMTSAAYANQDFPFDRLVSLIGGERGVLPSPFFQVFFVLENVPTRGGLILPDVTLEIDKSDLYTARFDLTLRIQETEAKQPLACHFEYNSTLFERSTILRMAEHFHRLLQTVVDQPARRLSTLSLLAEQERHQLVVEWNETRNSFQENECVHTLFETVARQHPHQVAVVCEEQQLSYAELNARANHLAQELRKCGVRPDTRVGLCVERSLEMVVGTLGILKAGAAYVPLDPMLPKGRLSFIVADANVLLLLTKNRLRARLPADGRVPIKDFEEIQCGPVNEEDLSVTMNSHHLAYMIYTSGSTGQPKGVMVAHQQVVNYIRGVMKGLVLPEAACRFALLSTMAADLGHTMLFGALCTGRILHVISSERAGNPDEFAVYMHRERIDVVKLTPSHLSALLHAAQPSHVLPTSCLILGGEAANWKLLDRLMTIAPHCELVNHYGPTETTVGVVTQRVSAQRKRVGQTIPIGRPLANTQAYILDPQREPVPIGMPGELYIGGRGVTWGYNRQPALTAEYFVPDHVGGCYGGRLYRTGDRARYLEDGSIEFLGRLDGQVKLRGFRVELGEIKAHLLVLEGVCDAVVLMKEGPADTQYVVAYVLGETGTRLRATDLKQQLARQLPEFMVPQAIIVMDRFPLTVNGKVDYRSFPPPDDINGTLPLHTEAPRNEMEQILVPIWEDILQREHVGIHDNFFEMGGDSILSLHVIARASRQGLKLTPKQLFESPTIAQLAAVASEGPSGTDVIVPPNGIPADCDVITPSMLPLVQLTAEQIERIVRAVPGGARNIQDIYPLAPLQEGMLFHHLMSESRDPYVLSTWLGFDTRTRLDGFLQTLHVLIDRYDILRTAVWWEEMDAPVQVVWKAAPVTVEEIHLNEQAGSALEQLRARYHLRHDRLNVRHAPLLRLHMAWNPADGRWLLQILWHHLIGDHVTMSMLTEEIQIIQRGQLRSLSAPRPFRNFVAETRQSGHVAEQEAFFTHMLGDVEEPSAPFGLRHAQGAEWGVDEARQVLQPRLAQRVRQCARKLGVSAASLLHLAWAQVLARVSGRRDVVFGTVLLGRLDSAEAVHRMPGMFLNTLPIRIKVGEESVAHSVQKTQALLTQLMRHEHASLALAQRCSLIPAPTPLFSALLNYRHSNRSGDSPKAGEVWEGIEQLGGENRTNYPLVLSVDDERGEGFVLTVQVEDRIEAQRVCAYVSTALEHLVTALERASETPASRIEILPQDERVQLLTDWNTVPVEDLEVQKLTKIFERQASQFPEAVAVVLDDQSVSYAELDRRANQLAHYLRKRGIAPEVLVGICLERSIEMIVGMLAILKAGGAYVPLDPATPEARLAFMVEDTQVRLVITTEHLGKHWSASRVPRLHIDTDAHVWANESNRNPEETGTPDDLAYVIFTSGSTGQPKGVMVSHANVVRLFYSTQDIFRFSHTDIWTVFHSFAFDFSVWECWGALLYGGRMVLVPYEISRSPLAFYALLVKEQVTVLNQTPSAFGQLIDAEQAEGMSEKLALRVVILGGEALTYEMLTPWFQFHSDARPRVINMYGITETTVHVTVRQVFAADVATASGSVIGNPIQDLQLYILNEHLEPVPIGVAGELYIGGRGVARGYLNRPHLTAMRFLPDPFSGKPDARVYRSGDLACYRSNGEIEYLGRIDQQVKIRGHRIELGEIEAVLTRCDGIRRAIVLAREDRSGDQRLVAYLVPREHVTLHSENIREALRNLLPEYMVPAVLVVLENLPLTSNGKIDRSKLPVPDVREQLAGQYVAPRTPTEERLSRIWAEVLGVEQIGIHQNFFDAGGHSLLAIQILSRLRQVFKVELSLGDFWGRPTIAEGAEWIEEQVIQKLDKLSESEAQRLLQ